MATAVACNRGSILPRHARARKHTDAVLAAPRGIESAATANVWRVDMPEGRPLSCKQSQNGLTAKLNACSCRSSRGATRDVEAHAHHMLCT